MHTLRNIIAVAAAIALLAACAEIADDGEMFDDDDPSVFQVSNAKADGFALKPGSYDAHAILRAANTLTLGQLDDDAGLNSRAARNIVAARDANGAFKSIIELDDVSYVGVRALTDLLAYATAQGWVGRCGDDVVNGPEACDGTPDCDATCGLVNDDGPSGVFVHGVEEGSSAAAGVLAAAHTLTFEQLDDDVGLDRRAARGIVEGRPFDDLADLDGVAYVAAKAFEQLYNYAEANGLVPADEVDPDPVVDDEPDTPAVHGIHEGSYEALGLLRAVNAADLPTLDHTVELDTRAAKNIYYFRLSNGDYASLEALDAVPYVGAAAFTRLLDFARAQGVLPSCGDRAVQPAEEACDGTPGCDEDCNETFRCGDGVVEVGEGCDDGNNDDADGCSAACAWEIARHDGGLGYENAQDVGPHRYLAGHFSQRSGHQYWRLEVRRPSRISIDIMANNRDLPIPYSDFLAGETSNAPNQAGSWSIGEHGVDRPWSQTIGFWRWYWDANCGWNGCNRPDYSSVRKYTHFQQGDANDGGYDGTFEVDPGVYYIGFHTGAGNQNYRPSVSYIMELDVESLGPVCGDGEITEAETCDDGNGVDGDGCSRRCEYERFSERENNNSRENANNVEAFRIVEGRITAGDHDWFAVEVGPDGTFEARLPSCRWDGFLELYDQAGDLVAGDDDSGGNYCPLLDVDGLTPGWHFLRLRHAAPDIAGDVYQMNLTF